MSERTKKIRRNLLATAAALGVAAGAAGEVQAKSAPPVRNDGTATELGAKTPEKINDPGVSMVMRLNPKFGPPDFFPNGPKDWRFVGFGSKIKIDGNNYVLADTSTFNKLTTGDDNSNGTIRKGTGFYKHVTSDALNFTPGTSSRYEFGVVEGIPVADANGVLREPMAIVKDVVVPTDGYTQQALVRLESNPEEPKGMDVYKRMASQRLTDPMSRIVEKLIGGFGKYAPWNGPQGKHPGGRPE